MSQIEGVQKLQKEGAKLEDIILIEVKFGKNMEII